MSWKICPQFRKYVKAIDDNCMKIVKSLNTYKSRNLSLIARETNMPPALVHYYYDKLARRGILRLNVDINMKRLGLTPVAVIVKPFNDTFEKVEKALKIIDYWREISKCYLSDQAYYYCYYIIPTERKGLFEEFINELKQREILDKAKIYWEPEIRHPNPNFQWFDTTNKEWNFQWDEWVNEFLTYISETGMETGVRKYTRMGESAPLDKTDFFILSKIEENSEVTFKDLALMLGVTPPTIRYHYYKHLIEYGIIRGFEPKIYPYPKKFAQLLLSRIKFENLSKLEAFIRSIEDKPFPRKLLIYEKELLIILKSYILIDQLPGFAKALTQMHSKNAILKYDWGLIDPNVDWRQLLPANLNVKGKWQYPHEEYLRKLNEIKAK